MVESFKGDLAVVRLVDVSYYLKGHAELCTLKSALAKSQKRVQHLDKLLEQKYSEIAGRWQKEQRALNRHRANPKKIKRDNDVSVL